MNQGKLEVVKQMARVNVDILGISELKWTGMGEFNSDDHCIYYCGHSQQKTPKCSPWMQSQKQQNDLRFQGKPFNITGIQVYAMNSMKRQKDGTRKDELPRLVGAQNATVDQWRNNSRKNEETEPKQNQHPVVDETGDGSMVQCCKKQYCIGT